MGMQDSEFVIGFRHVMAQLEFFDGTSTAKHLDHGVANRTVLPTHIAFRTVVSSLEGDCGTNAGKTSTTYHPSSTIINQEEMPFLLRRPLVPAVSFGGPRCRSPEEPFFCQIRI